MIAHWVIGLIVLPPSIILCSLAPAATRSARTAWRVIALIEASALIDVMFDLGLRVHDAVRQGAAFYGVYQVRRGFQIEVTAAAVVFATILTGALIWKVRKRGAPLGIAATAAAALVLMIIIEGVSLHQVDMIFYRQIGPMLAVSWGWTAVALVTGGAATTVWRR